MLSRFGCCALAACLALGPNARGEPTDRYGDPLPTGALARFGSARLRVSSRVLALAFWPDDRTLAACCEDGTVRLWDRAGGRQKRRLRVGVSDVFAAALVPGRKAVAVIDMRNSLVLWDTEAGKAAWKVALPQVTRWTRPAASPDGKLLAVSAGKGPAGLYDTATGRKVRALEGTGDARGLAFSPDGTLLAVVFDDKPRAALWDARTGKKVRDLADPLFFHSPYPVAFSPDGKTVAVGSHAVASDVATGKETSRFTLNYSVTGIQFASGGRTLLTAHPVTGELHGWDPATRKERFVRKVPDLKLPGLVISADGKALAVWDQSGECRALRLVDPATGKDLFPHGDGHPDPVHFVAFSDRGRTLLSGSHRSMRSWDAAAGKPIREVRDWFWEPIILSPDGNRLAELGANSVELWDLAAGKKARVLEYGGKDVLRAVAFSPDGKYLFTAHNKSVPQSGAGKAGGQDSLHVWDLATGKETRSYPSLTNHLYAELLITSDGGTAVTGSVDGITTRLGNGAVATSIGRRDAGELYVWDLRGGGEVRRLEGHTGAIDSLLASADGRLLLSGSADGTFRLWELVSGKTLFTFRGREGNSQVAALSPDGHLIATNCGPPPETIHLLSAVTGRPVGQLRGHGCVVHSLAFAPDGRRLASGLMDGTALVWDVSAAARAARPRPGRLGPAELDGLWLALADGEPAKANRAVGTLSVGGADAVRMLKGRLKAVEPADAGRVGKLLADLDAEQFSAREAAARELEGLGELARPALEAALRKRPSAEVRKRVEGLLARVSRRELGPAQLRDLRAVAVLEHAGTPPAREVLESLARGAPEARLTREARAALARLLRKTAGP